MQTLFIVALGTVIKSNGGTLTHGECLCSFDTDMTPKQIASVDEALACANLSLVDKKTYDSEQLKIVKGFQPTKGDWDLFSANDKVNVFPKYECDEFTKQFVGTVIDKNATHIIVEDEEGESFTVDPDQIFFNTDEIMHGK